MATESLFNESAIIEAIISAAKNKHFQTFSSVSHFFTRKHEFVLIMKTAADLLNNAFKSSLINAAYNFPSQHCHYALTMTNYISKRETSKTTSTKY